MASKIYGATSLIGGVAGSVDNIDGAALADKDALLAAVKDDAIYFHALDADSAAAEASPAVITPDTNPGDKRWILNGVVRIPNGATLPTNPIKGESFLHTPTGRSIFMVYNGTSWVGIQSMSSMTIYVDSTDGTDSINQGTGVDAAAYKTVQYAIDSIPGINSGNVIIYINGETYTESVTIQGKNFTGNYTITFQGTLSVSVGPNAQDSSVQGTGATQGSITDTGAFTGMTNKLLYSSNNAEYRIIDSVTADVGTIVGCWTAAPTGNYTIYDWATILVGKFTVKAGQLGIVCNDIKFYTTSLDRCISSESGSSLNLNRCWLTGTTTAVYFVLVKGDVVIDTCSFISVDANTVYHLVSYANVFSILRSKFSGGGYSVGLVFQGAYGGFGAGSIVDNCDIGTGAILVETTSVCRFSSSAATGYPRIRNCTLGLGARTGGQVMENSLVQYSGNTTNYTAIAATYGSIE